MRSKYTALLVLGSSMAQELEDDMLSVNKIEEFVNVDQLAEMKSDSPPIQGLSL